MSSLECFATWGLSELRQLTLERNLALQFERSARFREEEIDDCRGLFSLPLEQFGETAIEDVLHVARAMRLPPQTEEAIRRFSSAAAFVHFGFERSGSTLIGKCYLELPVPDSAAAESRLQFLGFKWSMNEPSLSVVTRYRSLPAMGWDETCHLATENVGDGLRPSVHRMLEAIRPNKEKPAIWKLLEVEDEGSNRRSYDLNVYEFEIAVGSIESEIGTISEKLSINHVELNAWLGANQSQTIGHLAVGTNRQGGSFVTVYHTGELPMIGG